MLSKTDRNTEKTNRVLVPWDDMVHKYPVLRAMNGKLITHEPTWSVHSDGKMTRLVALKTRMYNVDCSIILLSGTCGLNGMFFPYVCFTNMDDGEPEVVLKDTEGVDYEQCHLMLADLYYLINDYLDTHPKINALVAAKHIADAIGCMKVVRY